MHLIYDSPGYRLEGRVIPGKHRNTLELWDTHPTVAHPERMRKMCLTLSSKGFHELATLAAEAEQTRLEEGT